MSEYLLPYEALLTEAKAAPVPLTQYLREELPYLWRGPYLEMTPHQTKILVFTHGTFDYVYNDYASLESSGVVEVGGVPGSSGQSF